MPFPYPDLYIICPSVADLALISDGRYREMSMVQAIAISRCSISEPNIVRSMHAVLRRENAGDRVAIALGSSTRFRRTRPYLSSEHSDLA